MCDTSDLFLLEDRSAFRFFASAIRHALPQSEWPLAGEP
jgi:hypothetical protein